MPRRGRNTGTVYFYAPRKWIVVLPDRMGGLGRGGFESRAEAEKVLGDAIATGIAPPERVRKRRTLGVPAVLLDADDFSWARRMVSSLVRKHPYLQDDIEAEAMLALYLASLDYKEGGNHFRSYAAMKIRGAAIDFLRTQNRSVRNTIYHRKEPERHRPARLIDLDEQQWDRLPAPADDIEELIDESRRRRQLERSIASLPERHASMVRMYVFDEVQMKDVGSAFGVTESRVCQIVGAALEKIAGKKVSLKRIAA